MYVDAFAGAELQFGSGVARAAYEPTRAATALGALDDALPGPGPRALFVEEDPAHLQRIYVELEDVAGDRLRATRDFASLAPGEASLVEAPFAAVADDVARWIGNARAFVFLAPATARALPWTALRPLLALPDATLLVRFPHTDFEKQSRHVAPVADLPGFARRIVEGCSAFLGDDRHAWLPAWRAAAADGIEPALAGVIEHFAALLQSVAGGRAVRPIELTSADGARSWLFLVTADDAVGRVIEETPPGASPLREEEAQGHGTAGVDARDTPRHRGRRRPSMSDPLAAETESVDAMRAESPEAGPGEAQSGEPEGVEAGPTAASIEGETAVMESPDAELGATESPEQPATPRTRGAKRRSSKPLPAPSATESSETRQIEPEAVIPAPAPSPDVLDLFPDQFVEAAAPKQRTPRTPRREPAAADDGLFSFPLDGEGATGDPSDPP